MAQGKQEDRNADYQFDFQKQCQRGKVIVYGIVICHIITTLLSNCLGRFSIINLIIQVGLSMALLIGVNWVRWFFVIGALLELICTPYMLISIIRMSDHQIPIGILILFILVGIEAAVSGGLLAFNKSVSEFFYDQQTR